MYINRDGLSHIGSNIIYYLNLNINILMNNTGSYLPPSPTDGQRAIGLVLALSPKTVFNQWPKDHRAKHNLLFKNYNLNSNPTAK